MNLSRNAAVRLGLAGLERKQASNSTIMIWVNDTLNHL